MKDGWFRADGAGMSRNILNTIYSNTRGTLPRSGYDDRYIFLVDQVDAGPQGTFWFYV